MDSKFVYLNIGIYHNPIFCIIFQTFTCVQKLCDLMKNTTILNSFETGSAAVDGMIISRHHCLDRTPDCTFWTRIVASKMADRKAGER